MSKASASPLVRVLLVVGVSASAAVLAVGGAGCSNPAEDFAEAWMDAGANFPKPSEGSSSGGSRDGKDKDKDKDKETDEDEVGSSSSSSSSSSGAPATPDAGTGSSSGGPGNATCPGPAPQNAPYKPAAAKQTVCTAADLQWIAQRANAGASLPDIESGLEVRNAACAACAFTNDTAATWGPIVWVGNQADAFVNYGACFTHAPGGSQACGAAVFQIDQCLVSSCTPDACGSEAAVDQCYQAAAQNPAGCGRHDYVTPCGGEANVSTLFDHCVTYLDAIGKSCGGG